ncbi:type II restriction/modification system DNA methylase subunit YeeA [Marinobacterium sp. MBR-111]|jgi:type II restriction/modification system DNA methylase subunit YeeA|uniref:BREX-1 system adenine-specific DNA-methyltransferase PglX n=1 Tax=Marinobacterium sp. MBR-111 TaxID=3156463 RepID=UPI0033933EB8
MNTANIKKYAPKARQDFIAAMTKQAALYGVTAKGCESMEIRGDLALIGSRTFTNSISRARDALVKRIEQVGFAQTMEQAAYSWFNRLCAIRYMEIHGYLDHGRRVLSTASGEAGTPQILDDCLDIELSGLDKAKVADLKLDGTQDEALYRELLLAQCHALHEAMPFLFEELDDSTELLLPDNLTKTDSLIRALVSAIPEEDWQDVEIIGWLYQFYISEKKDQVIGKVVKSEDIPAATQLFTPNWIVQYLVQNSVGRQWLQTYPDSPLKDQMPYYIAPGEQPVEVQAQLDAVTPESIDPESIKVLDPACGSGHILVEAYKLLKSIYEERGYRTRDIPRLILNHNLFGLDIDDRAGQLAGFALMMLARQDDRRLFSRVASGDVNLNVLSLQETGHLNLNQLWRSLNLGGEWQQGSSQSLFESEQADLSSIKADNRYQLLERTLARFTEAKTFGSLIEVPAEDAEPLKELLDELTQLANEGDSMQKPAALQLLPYVQQAWVLSQRYDAVIANPPYMGSKGMNSQLKKWASKNYPSSKADLFSIFLEHAFQLLKSNGLNAQVNMQSWMFLSSFEKLRRYILDKYSIISLCHIGYNSFPTLNSKIAQACSFVVSKYKIIGYKSCYIDLNSASPSSDKNEVFNSRNESITYYKDQIKFLDIPGSPICFWVSNDELISFKNNKSNGSVCITSNGVQTGDNDTFVREWFEVSQEKVGVKWFPYNKGGPYKKWYGNGGSLIDWEHSGSRIKSRSNSCYRGEDNYFKSCITWTDVTWRVSGRYLPEGFISDAAGPCAYFENEEDMMYALGAFNTPLFEGWSEIINPTLHFQAGDFKKLPFSTKYKNSSALNLIKSAIEITKKDAEICETERDFKKNPLTMFRICKIREAYEKYILECRSRVNNLMDLEEENQKILFESLLIKDRKIPCLHEKLITLYSNPLHRFSEDEYNDDLLKKLRSTTFCDLISYIIGCILGRYSLIRSGLFYAGSGNNNFSELIENGFSNEILPDEDNIIPLTDQEWFADDATNRVRDFVCVVWGDEHLQENLDFVAESLCLHAIKPKRGESALDTIRRYLSTQFYKDHMRTYKKRPIYWLFSSGKQKAFECLVYLHRYNEGTLARMRTEYVIPLTAKLTAYADKLEQDKAASASAAETKRLEKEINTLHKQQAELAEFDEKLRHFADQRIALDLDDGVKVNYGKFGDLLAEVKAVTGTHPGKKA